MGGYLRRSSEFLFLRRIEDVLVPKYWIAQAAVHGWTLDGRFDSPRADCRACDQYLDSDNSRGGIIAIDYRNGSSLAKYRLGNGTAGEQYLVKAQLVIPTTEVLQRQYAPKPMLSTSRWRG